MWMRTTAVMCIVLMGMCSRVVLCLMNVYAIKIYKELQFPVLETQAVSRYGITLL